VQVGQHGAVARFHVLRQQRGQAELRPLECAQALQQEERDQDEGGKAKEEADFDRIHGRIIRRQISSIGDDCYAAGDKKGDKVNWLFSAVLFGAMAWVAYRSWRERVLQRQLALIRSHPFPQSVRMKFRDVRPELDSAQEQRVFDGLRDYFILCAQARGRFVAMPSQVADDAWHAFILHTRYYQDFCRKAFGRFLHHTPAEAMSTLTLATEGIRRAWRLACALEKINPKQPDRLPRLFALDGALAIPNGFRYDTHCTPGSGNYCASHIGCGSGCGGSSDSGSADSGCGGGGCGGGD
jgi:hypothetical protein